MSNKINNPFACIKLAKTTVICLDKEGVICDGELLIKKLAILDNKNSESQISQIISNVVTAVDIQNPLTLALKKQYDFELTTEVKAVQHNEQLFGASFKGGKTYIIGHPEDMLLNNKAGIIKRCDEYRNLGQDVYALGEGEGEIINGSFDKELTAVALIVVKENVRKSIPSSIKWCNENNIEVIVISRENTQKASAIAYDIGVENASKSISLKGMTDEQVAKVANQYSVFGDVSQEQKEIIVNALKASGENVLKVDSDFGDLPDVMETSKTLVSNLKRIGLLFACKAMFAILLTTILIFASISKLFDFPVNLYRFFVLDLFIDLFAAILLMLEKNSKNYKGKFVNSLLTISLPGALLMFISAAIMFSLYALQQNDSISLGIYNNQVLVTMCVIAFATMGVAVL